ncbi:hypothetical protein KR093_010710, partial [Drosophila rubida]
QRMLIQWKSFECVVNPSIVTFHKCVIVEPAKNLITAEVEYNRAFQKYNAKFVLYMPRPPFNEFAKHFEMELDICKFFQGAYDNKFVGTAYKSMLSFGNLPSRCPQPKGFYYYHNMSIGDNLPAFLPKYLIKIQLDFYLPQTPFFNVTLVGRLAHPTKQK